MLSFGIFINADQIYRLDIVNISDDPASKVKRRGDESVYTTYGGINIFHKRGDGAIALVKKALDTIDEDQMLRIQKAIELSVDPQPIETYGLMSGSHLEDFGTFFDMAYQWSEKKKSGEYWYGDVAMLSINVLKRFTPDETRKRFEKEFKKRGGE
jgi:hypothetical protein